MDSRTRFAAALGFVIALGSLTWAQPALADCNCGTGNCVYETCCYQDGDCKPVSNSEYKTCKVAWSATASAFVCSSSTSCDGRQCDPIFEG